MKRKVLVPFLIFLFLGIFQNYGKLLSASPRLPVFVLSSCLIIIYYPFFVRYCFLRLRYLVVASFLIFTCICKRKRIYTLPSHFFQFQLPLSLFLFLQFSYLVIQKLIFIYHFAQLHFQLFVFGLKLSVVLNGKSVILKIHIYTPKSSSNGLQLKLKFFVLRTQLGYLFLLCLVNLGQLLIFLILFC